MSFQDKDIKCSECGTSFTFTAKEQEFFASKGYTNEPKRCQTCRQARQNGWRRQPRTPHYDVGSLRRMRTDHRSPLPAA